MNTTRDRRSSLHAPEQALEMQSSGAMRELGAPLSLDRARHLGIEERVRAHDVLTIDLSGLSTQPEGPQGLRVVFVADSEDGPDVVLVCDKHGRDFWFSGVVALDEAHHTACERCAETSRLYARRALILDAYGVSTWLRVIGRAGR